MPVSSPALPSVDELLRSYYNNTVITPAGTGSGSNPALTVQVWVKPHSLLVTGSG